MRDAIVIVMSILSIISVATMIIIPLITKMIEEINELKNNRIGEIKMFKEKSTDEILKMIDEATNELTRRENKKERYEIEITRYEGKEKVQVLMWGDNTLDELIADIDKSVERMRPITVSVNTKKMFEKNLKDLQKEIIVEQNTVTRRDLQDLIISKYYQKITQDQLITESDVEMLKHIL